MDENIAREIKLYIMPECGKSTYLVVGKFARGWGEVGYGNHS